MATNDATQDDAFDDLKALLKKLLAAPANALKSFIEALNGDTRPHSLPHLSKLVSTHLGPDDAWGAAVEMLYLVRFCADAGYETDEAARWLRSVAEQEHLAPADLDWGQIENQLGQLVSPQSQLLVLSNALMALLDLPQVFLDASADTEFRPIFPPNDNDAPQIGIVFHRLKLDFLNGEEKKESFYISLDRRDLDDLLSVINGAIRRDESLRAIASNGGVPCF